MGGNLEHRITFVIGWQNALPLQDALTSGVFGHFLRYLLRSFLRPFSMRFHLDGCFGEGFSVCVFLWSLNFCRVIPRWGDAGMALTN